MVESHPAESTPVEESRLAICQRRIGYQFQNIAFLEAAFTHASGADHRLASNERLEFLGDAILGKIVCEELYHQFPEFLEGDLTKLKSIVVSRLTCAKISQALGLREFLVLGKGMTVHPAVPAFPSWYRRLTVAVSKRAFILSVLCISVLLHLAALVAAPVRVVAVVKVVPAVRAPTGSPLPNSQAPIVGVIR